MSLGTSNIILAGQSQLSVHHTKLRMMGTILVPIAVAFLVFGFFLLILYSSFGYISTTEYIKLRNNYSVIQWGGLYLHPLWILTSAVGKVAIVAMALVLLCKLEKVSPSDFGLVWSVGRGGWKKVLFLNLRIIGMLALCSFILLNFFNHFLGSKSIHFITNFLYNCYNGTVHIGSQVSGAVFEEIIFRGIYCTLLVRNGLRWGYTILITGVFFGLVHLINDQPYIWGYIIQVGFATVVGWFLGWMFYRTRTLVLPIIWHYAINIFIYLGALRPDILAKISSFLII